MAVVLPSSLLFVCVWFAQAVQNPGLPSVKQVLQSSRSTEDELVGSAFGPCTTDKDCFEAGEDLRCCPVGENVSAPGGCPATVKVPALSEEHVSVCQLPSHKFNIQKALCGCVKPTRKSCTDGPPFNWPYKPAKTGQKQWLLIGDSVSQGIIRHVRIDGTALKKYHIQISHIPVNGLNSRFGKRCARDWLDDPTRWDVISFNFGLHDIAHNTERLEPQDYAKTVKEIATQLKTLAPRAEIVFATTTPAPEECGAASNCGYAKDNIAELMGGLAAQALGLNDPVVHASSDPALYNSVAVQALNTLPFNVTYAHLYRRVTAACGEKFETCPKDCDKAGADKIDTECYIYPGDVHFTRKGYLDLAQEYTDAVAKSLGLL